MGNLQDNIQNYIDRLVLKQGYNQGKVATRLIEAGLVALATEEQGDFDHLIGVWGGALPWRCVLGRDGTIEISAFGTQPTGDTAQTAALRFAAEMFDGYARHHLAEIEERPDRADKALRNIEAAAKLYAVLGEPYSPPEYAPAPLPTPSEWTARPDSSPAQRDSDLQATGSAKKLLADLHIAEIGGEPILGVRVNVEDQPVMSTLVELGFLNRDDVSDRVTVTTKGKDAIGVRPDGVPDIPVEVASVTGNIDERELAGRYIDAKIKGVESWVAKNPADAARHDYEIMARVLTEIAYEFRSGLHLPPEVIAGRVIPYNEDRSTGVRHATQLQAFFDDVYLRNVKAGWWTNIETGEPKKRSVGELFMLMVTELCEAYDAWLCSANDDKLPDHPGVGVEIGDLLIRVADFCGALAAGVIPDADPAHNPGDLMFREVCDVARRYEAIRKTPAAVGHVETAPALPSFLVGEMVDAKLAFNARREDHKIENRLKDGGKKT